MKLLLQISICLFFSISIQSQGISFFEGNWESVLKEAQKEDKIIFIDAYAKWCGPCKKMASQVFTQEKVGRFFNDNFINVKMDMEEPAGIKFGKTYPVSAYPTLLFLDSEGNILKKVVGGKGPEDLIQLASMAIKSYDKSGQFAERYEAGERDFDLMINYIKELNKVDKPSAKIANDYLNSDPEISDGQKAMFLLAAVQVADSKLFEQLIDLKSEAIRQSSQEEYEQCISKAVFNTIEKAVDYDYYALYEEALSKFNASGIGDKKQFELEAGLYYNALNGNYKEWEELSKKFLKKYGKKNTSPYQEHITQIKKYFGFSPDAKTYLYTICEELIKKDDNADNYMLFLGFLMNDANYEKALSVCTDALKKHEDSHHGNQLKQMHEFLEKKNMD